MLYSTLLAFSATMVCNFKLGIDHFFPSIGLCIVHQCHAGFLGCIWIGFINENPLVFSLGHTPSSLTKNLPFTKNRVKNLNFFYS